MFSVQTMCCYLLFVIAAVTVQVHTTNGQSYFFAISQNQGNIYADTSGLREIIRNRTEAYDLAKTQADSDSKEIEDDQTTVNLRRDNTNRTYIVFKNILSRHQTDFSQSTMDVVTIIWYVATFFALAAFFLLMACSDRRRTDDSHDNAGNNGADGPIPPPTPSPSYSEFAPPSYETVMKLNHDADKYSIYVIPFPMEDTNNNNNNTSDKDNETTQTPNVHLQTINELQKYGSGS